MVPAAESVMRFSYDGIISIPELGPVTNKKKVYQFGIRELELMMPDITGKSLEIFLGYFPNLTRLKYGQYTDPDPNRD